MVQITLIQTVFSVMSRKAINVLLLLLVVGGEGWSQAAGDFQFALVPAAIEAVGKRQLANLESEAAKETFLDRLLGTSCFSESLRQISNDCKTMDQNQKSRLALKLVNCQLATQGDITHPCGNQQPLRLCTDSLPDRAYQLYVEFLSHADNMCLFIQNQNFEKYTETMLNRLVDGTTFAEEQIAALGEQAATQYAHITRQAHELVAKAEESLQMGKEQRHLQQQVLETARKHREESFAYFSSLSDRSREMLELQEEAYLKQQELQKGQQGMASMLHDGSRQVKSLFSFINQRAQEHLELQQQHEQQQRQLKADLRSLALDTQGLRSAVDVVVRYEQRSDAALIKLLGRSYTLEDAAFYGLGLLGVLGAGLVPGGSRARLPVLALLCSGLVGERMLLAKLHMSLERDPADELVVYVPPPLMVLTAAVGLSPPEPVPLNVKWTFRKALAGLAVLAALYAVLSHRNFEKDSFNAIRRIEEEARVCNTAHLEHLTRIEQRLAAIHAWEQQRLLALQPQSFPGNISVENKMRDQPIQRTSWVESGSRLPPGLLEGSDCEHHAGLGCEAGPVTLVLRDEGTHNSQGHQGQGSRLELGAGKQRRQGAAGGGRKRQQLGSSVKDEDNDGKAVEGSQLRTPDAATGRTAGRARVSNPVQHQAAGDELVGNDGKAQGRRMQASRKVSEERVPMAFAKHGKRIGEAAPSKVSKRSKQ